MRAQHLKMRAVALVDREVAGLDPGLQQRENIIEEFSRVKADGRALVAIKTESLLGDVGDALEFGIGEIEVLAGGFREMLSGAGKVREDW
ncbi:MAG: hypothetical protein ACHP9S_07515 [Terriglobales bacterium]